MAQNPDRSPFFARRAAALALGSTLLAGVASAAAPPPRLDLIPYPSAVSFLDGNFDPAGGMRIVLSHPANAELHRLGELAAEILRERLGLRPLLMPQGAGAGLGFGSLRIALTPRPRDRKLESYELEVGRRDITLSAPSPAGVFYGLQTLRQLLAPAAGEPIPSLRIEDAPRFAWRGLYVDRDRETLPVETLENWIELAARHKLNTLHWRLAGADVWRVQAVRYPRLEAPPALIYSQEDVRRLVAFAASRYVTLVPEVDLGRESAPALAAYPGLACNGDGCPTDAALEFSSDVLAEMVEIFPGTTIDLGAGGENGKDDPRRRLVEWLASRGRVAANPESIARFTGDAQDLAAIHAFEPRPDTGAAAATLLGGEAALAPETVPAAGRMAALAEALWTPERRPDLGDFEARWRVRQAGLPIAGADVASSPLSPR